MPNEWSKLLEPRSITHVPTPDEVRAMASAVRADRLAARKSGGDVARLALGQDERVREYASRLYQLYGPFASAHFLEAFADELALTTPADDVLLASAAFVRPPPPPAAPPVSRLRGVLWLVAVLLVGAFLVWVYTL